mgnify:CR=1 FL=1
MVAVVKQQASVVSRWGARGSGRPAVACTNTSESNRAQAFPPSLAPPIHANKKLHPTGPPAHCRPTAPPQVPAPGPTCVMFQPQGRCAAGSPAARHSACATAQSSSTSSLRTSRSRDPGGCSTESTDRDHAGPAVELLLLPLLVPLLLPLLGLKVATALCMSSHWSVRVASVRHVRGGGAHGESNRQRAGMCGPQQPERHPKPCLRYAG